MRRTMTAGQARGLLLLAGTLVLAGCSRDEPIQFEQGRGNAAEVSLATAVVLYVVLPVVLLLVVAALVWLPGMVRGERYRPGRGWSAPPVWFAGPPDPAAAVEQAQVEDAGRGGASGSW